MTNLSQIFDKSVNFDYLEILFVVLYNIRMKQIYGFIEKNLDAWGDIFEDDDKSPEVIISSACHIYFTEEGEVAIGFDMSLGLSKKQMKDMLSSHCKNPKVIKVV